MSNTSTDPRRLEWCISDDIVRLRKWGTSEIYNLPVAATDCLIGSSSQCAVRLEDSRVSAQHARLLRDRERWNLLDLSSKNGVRVDGVRQYTARLEPCMELGLGRLTLLAESIRSIELRGFLARLLGWGTAHWDKVDLALREIRSAQIQRSPFVLQGEGRLYAVARDLHHYLHGREAPFVVCDPDRNEFNATVRSPLNVHDWRVALREARGGMLCIPTLRPPKPFAKFLAMVCDECTPAVQVVICASPTQELCIKGTHPIVIPPLSSRAPAQLEHVIVEYAADAAKLLGADKPLSAEARAWVLAHAAQEGTALSLGAISKAALRLTALRVEGSIALAASRLGMAQVSLEKWFARRPPPPGLSAEHAAALAAMDEEGDA
jgi:hypothetical protein